MFPNDFRDDQRDAYDRGGSDGRRDEREDGRYERPISRGPAYDFGRTDRRYSVDDTRRELPMEETDRLIASDRVEGAPVYDVGGRRIGEVKCFMVEKRSGRVAYVVVRLRGGFVSGETYRPVDWNDLHYHERLDGYQLDLDRHELRRDRSFATRG